MSPSGSVLATPANVTRGIDLVERQSGGGGTELMGGLEASYRIPRQGQGVSRTVVVVTDGYVGVEAQAFRFIRERLDQANLFAFGIGTSVNRALIEGMARAGQGEPFVVLRPEKAAAEAEKLRAYIEQPVLTRIAVTFDGFGAAEASPAKIPDLMARRPLVVFGKYRGELGGRIRVAGLGGGGAPFSRTIEVKRGSESQRNEALRWLWARSWVATLDDERHLGGGKMVEEAITDLGLRHDLLTPFTSFVAVDSEIANQTGQSTPVRQPLPMPAGVPNSAVGRVAAQSAAAAPAGVMHDRKASKGKGSSDDLLEGTMSGERSGRSASSKAEGPARREPAPSPVAAPSAAAPPPPPPRPHVPSLSVARTTADGLGEAAPLVAAVKARLAALRGGCVGQAGQVVLRLHVDAAGKVVAIDVASGDAALGACLRGKLLGLGSATRATGKTGTLTVTLRAMI